MLPVPDFGLQTLKQHFQRHLPEIFTTAGTHGHQTPSYFFIADYQLIVGDKEVAGGLVAVRTRSGEDLGQMTLEALLQRFKTEIKTGSAA